MKIEEKSEGGILLLDSNREKEGMAREEGIIQRIGVECFTEEKDEIKVGDVCAFARYGGKSLGKDEDGNEIRVIKDVDVLAIREEE